jgi:hypothetical protein
MDFIFELLADLFLGEEKPSEASAVVVSDVANESVVMPIDEHVQDPEEQRNNLFGLMEFH